MNSSSITVPSSKSMLSVAGKSFSACEFNTGIFEASNKITKMADPRFSEVDMTLMLLALNNTIQSHVIMFLSIRYSHLP